MTEKELKWIREQYAEVGDAAVDDPGVTPADVPAMLLEIERLDIERELASALASRLQARLRRAKEVCEAYAEVRRLDSQEPENERLIEAALCRASRALTAYLAVKESR